MVYNFVRIHFFGKPSVFWYILFLNGTKSNLIIWNQICCVVIYFDNKQVFYILRKFKNIST